MDHEAYHLKAFKRQNKPWLLHDPNAYSVAPPRPGHEIRKAVAEECFERRLRAKWQEKRMRLRHGEEIPSA